MTTASRNRTKYYITSLLSAVFAAVLASDCYVHCNKQPEPPLYYCSASTVGFFGGLLLTMLSLSISVVDSWSALQHSKTLGRKLGYGLIFALTLLVTLSLAATLALDSVKRN